jgi:hypothetical protein
MMMIKERKNYMREIKIKNKIKQNKKSKKKRKDDDD